jgi:hypothetical protein
MDAMVKNAAIGIITNTVDIREIYRIYPSHIRTQRT